MDSYCKLYLNLPVNYEKLIEQIVNQFNGKVLSKNSIDFNGVEVDIEKNENRDDDKSKEFPDGFLHFNYYLDIDSSSLDSIKLFVSQLLSFLWDNNIPSIAACDYEDDLPELGGYNSLKIPWPK